MAERWAVIADDLTGALDTALQFRKAGKQTIVSTHSGVWPSRGSVVALSTETRHVSAASAAASVTAAFRTLPCGTLARIYKKTDSLLRGNIGPELRALCDAADSGPLVFAPAYPTGGRTTIDGTHRLEGVPIAEVAPGRDPVTPVLESHIPTLLWNSAGLKAERVPLNVVRGEQDGFVEALTRAQGTGVDIVVPDVETDGDLRAIASGLRASAAGRISAGSAGLAEYLVRPDQDSIQPTDLGRSAFVAAVVGTPSAHTKVQVERTLGTGFARRMRIRSGADIEAAIRETCPNRQRKRLVIFDTTIEGTAPRPEERQRQLRRVGDLCRAIVGAVDQPGLILTGGDTARAALDALEVDAIEVIGELEWGVPGGHALRGTRRVASVVTKGGNMGGPDALTTAFRSLCSRLSQAA
ncbi:MAG: four-carbon acid sugar kinase family protein [Chloroflexota bacterium]|nr:four-carbon acid sugar kinase family protein [Chloroflexota bacterium]MDE2918747.1 four-carbon acid sugar kinase family protein [Chloroflexota bacterium]